MSTSTYTDKFTFHSAASPAYYLGRSASDWRAAIRRRSERRAKGLPIPPQSMR